VEEVEEMEGEVVEEEILVAVKDDKECVVDVEAEGTDVVVADGGGAQVTLSTLQSVSNGLELELKLFEVFSLIS
jgi:hypothetical protein